MALYFLSSMLVAAAVVVGFLYNFLLVNVYSIFASVNTYLAGINVEQGN